MLTYLVFFNKLEADTKFVDAVRKYIQSEQSEWLVRTIQVKYQIRTNLKPRISGRGW